MENVIIIETLTAKQALDSSGKDWWDVIPHLVKERAITNFQGKNKTKIIYNPTCSEWQRIEPDKLDSKLQKIADQLSNGNVINSSKSLQFSAASQTTTNTLNITKNDDGADFSLMAENLNFVHKESISMKPKKFIINDLYWKLLVRNVLMAKNTLILGPSGTGKTSVVYHLSKVLERTIVNIPLGNAQHDPKTLLLGTTQYNAEQGTFFGQSAFITAIQEENAIILLDELSRPNPDAWNILLPAIDPEQRFVRLDDVPGSPIINVHPTVTFIATANIGAKYTATKVLDQALVDRFPTIINMPRLSRMDELLMLQLEYPNVPMTKLNLIVNIVDTIRTEYLSNGSKLSNDVSARISKEMTELVRDGFSVSETCNACIYPIYSDEGGTDSEQTFVRQLIQGYIPAVDTPDQLFNSSDAN